MINKILRNFVRLGLVSIYPLIIFLCFYLIWRKDKYRKAIKENYKKIIFCTLIFAIVITVGLIVFFSIEDTIYVYDYAGHWRRSLILREMFFKDPLSVLPKVYDSMLNDDYSFLPALFQLGPMVLNTSYSYFCIVTFFGFLIPTFVLFQIMYCAYFGKNSVISLLAMCLFYPIYITLFYGKLDIAGLFFVLMAMALIVFPNFEEIDFIDNCSMNLFGFVMIFLRRWYLYTLITIYLVYFVKYILNCKNKPFKDFSNGLIKIFTSGFVLLLIIIVFFMPFFKNVIGNNFAEAYDFYNREGKITNLINFYSPIIILISFYGCYILFKSKNTENRKILLYLIILSIVPTMMFWHVQSFEYHHYNIINLNVLFLFTIGLSHILTKNILIVFLTIVLLGSQVINIFIENNIKIPLATHIKRIPEVRSDKRQIIELTNYLKSITTEQGEYAYLASNTYYFNDDLLRNAILPDLDCPNIDSAVFDLRDGFPKDLQYVRYIITVDPILYMDEDYQHMFEVITNSILNEPEIKKLYNPIKKFELEGMELTIFEKTSDWTTETKQYFYKEMLKYYPDKEDYFLYILD